jgi:hypothetical protein
MKGKCILKPTIIIAIILSLGAFPVPGFIPVLKAAATEPEGSGKAGLSGSKPCEGRVIRLDKAAQEKGGILAAPLKTIFHTPELRAYGVVLSPESLADLRNRHTQARAQMENAATRFEISKKEYERLKKLNADNRNVSDRELQAAESTYRTDKVNARTAHEALVVLKGIIQAQWGEIITGWLWSGAPAFDRLLQQLEVLVQITLPRDAFIARMPETVEIRSLNNSLIKASFVSASPRTEARIQGLSYFYLASAATGMLPAGMTVTADVPAGSRMKGFFIPGSAVVWLHGNPWVYVQQDEQNFVRCKVSTGKPLENGYFVADDYTGADRIVIRGAQLILSEEFRSRIEGVD